MNDRRQDPASNADNAPKPSERSQRGLDWLNFFVADVQTSFGPFVHFTSRRRAGPRGGSALLSPWAASRQWPARFPGGALVDAVRSKRALVAGSLVLIAIGALIFAFLPSFPFVLAAEVIHGSTGGVTGLALTAIALGLVGHRALVLRLGRNRRYNSIGNALTAGLMGLLGHFVSKRAPFLAAVALCAPALFALTRIRGGEIDHARARSAPSQTKRKGNAPGEGQEEKPAHWLAGTGLAGLAFLWWFVPETRAAS